MSNLREYLGEIASAGFFTFIWFGVEYLEKRPSSFEAYALLFISFSVAFCVKLAWRLKSELEQ